MEAHALLGFEEEPRVDDQETTSSCGYKLVPWMNWDEWDFVRDSLFSSSPDSIALAFDRVSAWRSRGCLPVVIEVTASIIEIQQKDPFFRRDLQDESLHSEEILAMLYCMAIMRLVNGVVEKKRKKEETSIAKAADEIHIPRMLIDIRHEASHRDLPSLPLVRHGSIMALDWLRSYYWNPQKEVIPFQRGGFTYTRKEIKSKLCELAFCMKFKQIRRSNSSMIKGKRGKHCELLCGRSKFFSLAAGKLQPSKSGGYKRHITKTLKSLVQLYSSFSSEVVSLLLEFLLRASDSSDLVENSKDFQVEHSIPTVLNDWKVVITKFSSKEPELILSLLKVVLDMIQTREAMEYGTGSEHLLLSEQQFETHQIERLSSMFRWLVGKLKGLKPLHCNNSASKIEKSSSEIDVPKAILMQLLRKCLLVSAPGNNQLMDSALLLADLTGNRSLMEKLKKISLLYLSNSEDTKEDSSFISYDNILTQQQESIHQAAKKLELVNFHGRNGKVVKTRDSDVGNSNRWIVAESWNPCPLGMLPRDVGSSGRLPVLSCNINKNKKVPDLPARKELWEMNQVSGKRVAGCDPELTDNPSLKKMRETVDDCVSEREDVLSVGSVGSRLLIDGVWKEVGERELVCIESAVRILA